MQHSIFGAKFSSEEKAENASVCLSIHYFVTHNRAESNNNCTISSVRLCSSMLYIILLVVLVITIIDEMLAVLLVLLVYTIVYMQQYNYSKVIVDHVFYCIMCHHDKWLSTFI